MVTNHWVEVGSGGPWAPGGALVDLDIPIPAGATLKRFLAYDHEFVGTSHGAGQGAVGNFTLFRRIWIVGGPYNNHTLWQDIVSLTSHFLAFYDVGLATQIYSMQICAGDQGLMINERCAYGKRTGPGFTLRYSATSRIGAGFTGLVSNANQNRALKALYETLP